MALLDIRQRAGYLFLAVMLGHVLLISAQVNSRSRRAGARGRHLRRLRRGAARRLGRRLERQARVDRLRRPAVDVKAENDELKRQLAAAQVALQEQRALADRTRGLERLLDLRDRSNLKTVAAEIIAAGATPDFRTLTIDKGTRDGVRADMAVIAPAGVVGRVVVPSRARRRCSC